MEVSSIATVCIGLQDGRPARECFEAVNGRFWVDDVASRAECLQAVMIGQRAMNLCCDSDGEGKLFPPHIPEASQFLGDAGVRLFAELADRVTARVSERYGEAELANSLLSWISGSESGCPTEDAADLTPRSFDWQRDAASGTYAPHVDKANQPLYDISALLYLTTAGEDFSGGFFAFNDVDCDRMVRPVAGRLLAFPSGFDNLHQVRPVRRGERLVLSMWYKLRSTSAQ